MPDGDPEQNPSAAMLTAETVPQHDDATPTQPVDTGGSDSHVSETVPSTPPVEKEPPAKVDPRPRDEFGRFKPESDVPVDPVQDAIARLAKPDTPVKPDATAAKPTEQKPVGKPDSTAKQPAATAQPEAKPAKPDVEKPDPLADLIPSDAEKAHWSERTKKQYDKLFARTRELVEQREKDPDFVTGREFNKLTKEYALDNDMGFVPPEQLAGLIQAQGAINRALTAESQGRAPAPSDLEPLKLLGDAVDKLRGRFGLVQAPQTPAPIVPFTGELSQAHKDLIEVYGIDEQHVRMLAAIEAGAKAPATAPPPQTTPQQAAQPPVPPQQRPQGVDMVDLFARRLQAELAMKGDSNPTQTMRVLLNHPATKSEVMRRFPGTTPADVPAVFNALDARERYEVLSTAHTVMTKPAPKVPVRSTTPPPPTSQRTHTGSSAPRKAAPDANGDPVAAAIAHMARPE